MTKIVENHKGFTIIEIIVVSVLLALIGVMVFNSLTNGIDSWKRNNDQLKKAQAVRSILYQIGLDIRSTPVLCLFADPTLDINKKFNGGVSAVNQEAKVLAIKYQGDGITKRRAYVIGYNNGSNLRYFEASTETGPWYARTDLLSDIDASKSYFILKNNGREVLVHIEMAGMIQETSFFAANIDTSKTYFE